MSTLRFLPLVLCIALAPATAEASVTLLGAHTASDRVVVVSLSGSTSTTNEVSIADPALWTVGGQPPLAINQYVMQADVADYHVYLTVPPLVPGTSYPIVTPHGNTTLVFDDHQTFCESIKTNQGAYSARARNNRALFAIWLGDGGGKPLAAPLPAYEVFAMGTGTVVATGTLVEAGANASSGDTVYSIDLSTVPEGGPYRISVAGMGVSHPFGVGGEFSKRLAHLLFRAQFHQRCGIPLQPPYTWNIRPAACHTTVYQVGGPIGEANIVVAGTEPTFTIHGGYHDAGDADRRAYHMANPVVNLMVYEAFPELFTDGQFDIPDRFDEDWNVVGQGNGVPDIIDEAAWGTLAWEHLQNADGSIQFGTETKGYPEPFLATMDQDTKRYGTVKVDDRAAAVGAGLFLHLARHLKASDPARAAKLAERGQLAYAYVEARMAAPEKLYFFVQKYLWNGDEAAHAQVKALKSAVDTYKNNTLGIPGYSLNDAKFDNPAYFVSYLVEKTLPTDPEVVAYFAATLKAAADANVAEWKKRIFPVGNDPAGTSWGHNVRQPSFATAPLLQYRFSQDQTYLDAAADLMGYLVGLNPLGISYVTGIGFHQVHNPHDRECAYTKSQGLGPKPGITVFGPGTNTNNVTSLIFPAMSDLPKERQFADNLSAYSMTEFTIFETMVHNALFTVLAGGGKWDDTRDPFTGQPITKTGVPDAAAPKADANGADPMDAGAVDGGAVRPTASGCGCSTSGAGARGLTWLTLVALGLTLLYRRARLRRK
jgi:endoglucanase